MDKATKDGEARTAQVAGIVLAGGQSSRMGRDKALLQLGGLRLLVRTARLIQSAVGGPATVVGGGAAYRSLGLRVLEDDWPGAGPLGAIATTLRVSEAPWCLVVACDLPYLTKEWLDYLIARALASEADAVVPISSGGAEPLCAAYHQKCAPVIRAALEAGTRKVTDGLASLLLETISPMECKPFDRDGLLFKNMNSPADYQEAQAKLDRRAPKSSRT